MGKSNKIGLDKEKSRKVWYIQTNVEFYLEQTLKTKHEITLPCGILATVRDIKPLLDGGETDYPGFKRELELDSGVTVTYKRRFVDGEQYYTELLNSSTDKKTGKLAIASYQPISNKNNPYLPKLHFQILEASHEHLGEMFTYEMEHRKARPNEANPNEIIEFKFPNQAKLQLKFKEGEIWGQLKYFNQRVALLCETQPAREIAFDVYKDLEVWEREDFRKESWHQVNRISAKQSGEYIRETEYNCIDRLVDYIIKQDNQD